MVEYKLKYEGEKIDELLEAVDNGSVVVSNTVSVIESGNGKPVSSNAIHHALDNKVDKVHGMGLSEWNYTGADRDAVATVKDGSVITNHADKITDIILDNTDADILPESKNPVSGEAVSKGLAKKANTTEYYPAMAVGVADNLRGRGEATEEEFTYRPSAGASDSISEEGVATMKRIKGNSLVWAQYVTTFEEIAEQRVYQFEYFGNGVFEVINDIRGDQLTLNVGKASDRAIPGHKYLFYVDADGIYKYSFYAGFSSYSRMAGNWIIDTCVSSSQFIFYPFETSAIIVPKGTSATIHELLLFDLTQMFGAGYEPTTLDEFYARIPEGVDINAYNEGELISMNATAIETTGFNQFNGEYAEVLPHNTYYLGGEYTSIGFAEELGGTTEEIVLAEDRLYTPATKGYIYASGANININLSHSGVRDGEYEPYEESIKDLSVIQKYFPNGMKSAGSVYDEITETEAIQRIGEVDLGSLNWNYTSTEGEQRYVSYDLQRTINVPNSNGDVANTRTTRYFATNFNSMWNNTLDKTLAVHSNGAVAIKDLSYKDVTTFKNSLQGVMLYYELAEPITTPIVTRDINLNYPVWDWGTERAVSDVPSAPFRADTIYGFNAVDRIRDNSRDIETLNSEITNKVSAIRVNNKTITRKDSTGLLDIGDVSNLYVADFTIHDLSLLLYGGEIETLEVNGKALLQALKDHKAIGVLYDNNTPSMSLASVYTDDCINLTIICDDRMYTTIVVLPDNYDEVEESKSGIIYKGQTTDYQLGSHRSYLLDIIADDVREAYSNNQEITCDYNALHNAVISHYYISMETGYGGAVLVNASLTDENSILLSYIDGASWWYVTVYQVEDEDGNVYGRVFGNEINNLDLYETKNGSRYIITDFTIENIIDSEAVTITSELVKAIRDNRPLAIYDATSESNIYDITGVIADLATRTYISLKVSYSGGGNLIIDSSNVVTEGGMIRASSYWKSDPNTRSIANSSGGIIHLDDGVITVPPSFFADKSVDYSESNAQAGTNGIRQQITILGRPLTGDGQFIFQLPTMRTAVEYTIRFRVSTQCTLKIMSPLGALLNGVVFGRTLTNIPSGKYLMKITLFTYINTKGTELTEYIAEVMQTTK